MFLLIPRSCCPGFFDKLRLMNILIDDIKPFREFPIKNSSVCSFSSGGNLLAAVSAKDIQVYSSINFKKLVSCSKTQSHVAIFFPEFPVSLSNHVGFTPRLLYSSTHHSSKSVIHPKTGLAQDTLLH